MKLPDQPLSTPVERLESVDPNIYLRQGQAFAEAMNVVSDFGMQAMALAQQHEQLDALEEYNQTVSKHKLDMLEKEAAGESFTRGELVDQGLFQFATDDDDKLGEAVSLAEARPALLARVHEDAANQAANRISGGGHRAEFLAKASDTALKDVQRAAVTAAEQIKAQRQVKDANALRDMATVGNWEGHREYIRGLNPAEYDIDRMLDESYQAQELQQNMVLRNQEVETNADRLSLIQQLEGLIARLSSPKYGEAGPEYGSLDTSQRETEIKRANAVINALKKDMEGALEVSKTHRYTEGLRIAEHPEKSLADLEVWLADQAAAGVEFTIGEVNGLREKARNRGKVTKSEQTALNELISIMHDDQKFMEQDLSETGPWARRIPEKHREYYEGLQDDKRDTYGGSTTKATARSNGLRLAGIKTSGKGANIEHAEREAEFDMLVNQETQRRMAAGESISPSDWNDIYIWAGAMMRAKYKKATAGWNRTLEAHGVPEKFIKQHVDAYGVAATPDFILEQWKIFKQQQKGG